MNNAAPETDGVFAPRFPGFSLRICTSFVEYLTADCSFITHHTAAADLTGPNFLSRKKNIAALDHAIQHGDMDRTAAYRRSRRYWGERY